MHEGHIDTGVVKIVSRLVIPINQRILAKITLLVAGNGQISVMLFFAGIRGVLTQVLVGTCQEALRFHIPHP